MIHPVPPSSPHRQQQHHEMSFFNDGRPSEIEETTFLCGPQRQRLYGTLGLGKIRSHNYLNVVEHTVTQSDTLQGLALKYGSTMTEIKRLNKLFSPESMFLKTVLLIPVLDADSPSAASTPASSSAENSFNGGTMSDPGPANPGISTSDITVSDSLNKNGANSNSKSPTKTPTLATPIRTPGGQTLIAADVDDGDSFQDIFSRIDKTIHSGKKVIRRIGRESSIVTDHLSTSSSSDLPSTSFRSGGSSSSSTAITNHSFRYDDNPNYSAENGYNRC